MPLVSLNGISFDYGRVPILRDADLSLEPGERAAIVGRNGVGKSSLFAIIDEEMRPDTGTMERSRRLRIGHLKQDHALSGDLTLFDAVRAECHEIVELDELVTRQLAKMEDLPTDGDAYAP